MPEPGPRRCLLPSSGTCGCNVTLKHSAVFNLEPPHQELFGPLAAVRQLETLEHRTSHCGPEMYDVFPLLRISSSLNCRYRGEK